MKRKICKIFDLSLASQNLVSKEFKNRENYIDINGNHPESGKGIGWDDIVFNKKDLINNKLLINEKVDEAKQQMEFIKKHETTIFLL